MKKQQSSAVVEPIVKLQRDVDLRETLLLMGKGVSIKSFGTKGGTKDT